MKHEITRLASGHNWDDHGFDSKIRFCPACSTRNLQRHDRKVTSEGKPIVGKEFWCLLCGFSFNVRASAEWNLAIRIFRQHRQLRNGSRLILGDYAQDVQEAWKLEYEKPTAINTWPSRGGNSIADKLKQALGVQ